MSDEFEWSEFRHEGGVSDPNFHFASLHSPKLKYDYIQKSEQSIDSGLSEFEDSEEDTVQAYSSVSIFRDVMEYIEEFGIYMYSIFDPNTEFVDSITRIDTVEIKQIFSALRDREYEYILNFRKGEFDSFDELLYWAFGYNMALQKSEDFHKHVDQDIELTTEKTQDAARISVEVIKDKLERIGWFFLSFDEAYNAIKHGNRVTILNPSEFQVESEDGDEPHQIDIDGCLAEFLCKKSGERAEGERYTFSVHVDSLRSISMATAQEVWEMYSPLYEVSQTMRESEKASEGDELAMEISFFGIHETGQGGSHHEFTQIENPDGSIWLPKDMVPDEFEDDPLDVTRTFYAGFEERNGDFIMKTTGDESPTYEYPIAVEGNLTSNNNEIVGWEGNLDFDCRLPHLPLWQVIELVALQEQSPYDTVIIEIPEKSISDRRPITREAEIPDIPIPEYWDLLKFAHRVGLASETAILYPAFVTHDAGDILESYQQKELTKENAKQCLQDLAVATMDSVYTEVNVCVLDPNHRVENRYKKLDAEVIRDTPGAYVMKTEDNTIQEISIKESYPDSFDRKDPGYIESLGIMLVEETADQAFQMFCSEGLKSIADVTRTRDQTSTNACISINRIHGQATHWYWFDRLIVNIYSGIPPHAAESIDRLLP